MNTTFGTPCIEMFFVYLEALMQSDAPLCTNSKRSQVLLMLMWQISHLGRSHEMMRTRGCTHVSPAANNQVVLPGHSSKASVGNTKLDENRSNRRRCVWVTLFLSWWQLWHLVETAHWCELRHDLFITSRFHLPAFLFTDKGKSHFSKTFRQPCSRNNLWGRTFFFFIKPRNVRMAAMCQN